MRETETGDVIVVGGGLAGLAAAAYLARGGRRVTLLEKAGVPGGRARTRTQDGFRFNLGAHALYRSGQGAAVLRELGVPFAGGVPRVSGGFAVRAGVFHTLPVGLVSLLSTGLLRPSQKLQAARVLAGLPRVDTNALRSLTLSDWLCRNVPSAAVRELLQAIVRVATYTDDPERLSAGAALAQVQAAGRGVLYLHEGWQCLVDGLKGVAEASGARVCTHSPVTSVIRDERGVHGVRLEGGRTLAAGAVVIAGSPAMAAELTRDGPASVLSDWARQAVPVQAACLDVALRVLPRPAARFALGIDEPLYASVHSCVARLAPDGGGLIHSIRYGGLRGDSPAAVEARLMALLDGLQPGWQRHLVRQRFLPELTVATAVPPAASGGTSGRPGPLVEGVSGLYVAGDWVGPVGLLADASLASARLAARALLESPTSRRPAA